jgi:cytochrome c oxidase assembly factor CtaG
MASAFSKWGVKLRPSRFDHFVEHPTGHLLSFVPFFLLAAMYLLMHPRQ